VNITDWISAVSASVGAIGTVGALWVGALTFRRQIIDKHREQASGVSAGARYDNYKAPTKWYVFVLNSSGQPLYGVHLQAQRLTHGGRQAACALA
jgi:hypothetical protein